MTAPEKLYNLILADPPWRYSHATPNRRIENHYPTMADEDICALEPPAAENCVLFLWATSPKLPLALEVVRSWGFEYKTSAVWDKMIIGMGYYFRGQHELLLLGIKGNMWKPAQASRKSSVIRARRGEHSVKPLEVYEMIEGMYPDTMKLEMFARFHLDGWDVWGNEAPTATQKRFSSYQEGL